MGKIIEFDGAKTEASDECDSTFQTSLPTLSEAQLKQVLSAVETLDALMCDDADDNDLDFGDIAFAVHEEARLRGYDLLETFTPHWPPLTD